MCLSDYCDVMRCEVLAAREVSPGLGGTDIEVWRHSGAHQSAAHRTALSVSSPRDLARVTAFPTLKLSLGQGAGTGAGAGRGHRQQQQQQQPQSPLCPVSILAYQELRSCSSACT